MIKITLTSVDGHKSTISATTVRGLRRALDGFRGRVSRDALRILGVCETADGAYVLDAVSGHPIAILADA